MFLYNGNRLENILNKVDEGLGTKEDSVLRTPNILRTIIARNSPDVYLLLMYMARKDMESPINLSAYEIKALAFMLHWFGNDKKHCVQEIFHRFKNGINISNILQGISRLMHDCHLLHVYTPKEVEELFIIGNSKGWRIWNSLPAPAKHFFNRTFWYGTTEAKQMLLYAERQYLNTNFRNYDPARQDMWAEENRPWDFDHIVPQEWIRNKRGPFRDYDKDWLWSIGNMAAISFEANRSKGNTTDYSEYYDNAETLCFLPEVESLKPNITDNNEDSVRFAKLTYERYCMIYTAVYRMIRPMVDKCILSETLQKRKNLILSVMECFPDARPHFAADDGNDHWIEREQDWAREWIGVGIVMGNFMVCYEWHGVIRDGIVRNAEIGIRKAPGTHVTRENQKLFSPDSADYMELNDWWYQCDYDFQSLDIRTIVDKMNEYTINLKEKLQTI